MRTDGNDDRGLDQIESYLLWSAEVEEGRRQAARFTAHLPWLTTAQREEVERVYLADRLALSRATLHRIGDRAAELREEYGERYRHLRRRCVGTAVAGVGLALSALGATVFLTR
ncbi:hypothetical protein OG552_01865 [Streptomyces sp. NBC_01476]|uniref:hypothetical protein n=1 Tax=Streptomyces sp. NBC_01476 TaxID=2903881 RepID=UPI002E354EBB|nr:hypothetical protein [Streptomyces sp. NBC_01476]